MDHSGCYLGCNGTNLLQKDKWSKTTKSTMCILCTMAMAIIVFENWSLEVKLLRVYP